MNLTLHVWRQQGPDDKGRLERHQATDVSPDMSFLEMLDEVNEALIKKGREPIVFDHDCREGICGTCSQVINGQPHGPQAKTTVCQLHMRQFKDGDEIYIEPWRARAFPVLKDLIVDRTAMDRIVEAGRRSTRRQRYPDSQSRCRHRHGCRRMHRLRCLCGRLPQRLGNAIRFS